MTISEYLRAIPKPVYFILAFSLVVVIIVFGFGPQQFEQVCEFSGGAGETTTESFRLERPGRVRLGHHSYVLIRPEITVYRVGESQPFCTMFWSPSNGHTSPDDISLEPGEYYLTVTAGWGASLTIAVEEEV